MDNKFEPVCEHVPSANMNTPAAAEHIAEIEWNIRYIKERAHGILCTLPYPALPTQTLIHLLHFVVMWLNNFPSATGILTHYSPWELIVCDRLDFKKHCRALFGSYCKVHKENMPTNSIRTCGGPAICLGPTGNRQGSYFFFSLVTGQIIKRRAFTKLPMPQSFIDWVAHFAKKSKSLAGLIFENHHRQPFDWTDNGLIDLTDTPMAPYPDIPAEMLGVQLLRSDLPPVPTPAPTTQDEPD
jgi:hypothetical protein